jgi:hypothetical protein
MLTPFSGRHGSTVHSGGTNEDDACEPDDIDAENEEDDVFFFGRVNTMINTIAATTTTPMVTPIAIHAAVERTIFTKFLVIDLSLYNMILYFTVSAQLNFFLDSCIKLLQVKPLMFRNNQSYEIFKFLLLHLVLLLLVFSVGLGLLVAFLNVEYLLTLVIAKWDDNIFRVACISWKICLGLLLIYYGKIMIRFTLQMALFLTNSRFLEKYV